MAKNAGDAIALRPEGLPEALRGFGPAGLLAMLAIFSADVIAKPASAILVLLWARWSRTPWSEIGYARPRSWIRGLAFGLLFGSVFKVFLKSVVMPLLGADPINRAYHHLAHNRALLPAAIFAMIVQAGFGEETLFRGYLFERLGKLTGGGAGAKIFIVLFTAGLFGLGHFTVQGLAGAEQATITGLALGSIFAVTGSLWIPMVAHAAFDLTALAIIYWDQELRVAQLIFK
jgi:uncharacterized protein